MPSETACCSTSARPTRWSMMGGGTLPLRNPGMLTCSAMCSYAWAIEDFRSSGVTAMLSLTRVGLSFSIVVFTALLLILEPRESTRVEENDHPGFGRLPTARIRLETHR